MGHLLDEKLGPLYHEIVRRNPGEIEFHPAVVEVAVSVLAVGVGKPEPRYLYSGEVRWRFSGWLYAVGQGGTLLFPTPSSYLLQRWQRCCCFLPLRRIG